MNRCVRSRGFTLTELAVVLTIVALLLGSLMYTLSAQIEQRNFEETRRRLEQARELVMAFAVVNGRLPCPARSAATTTPVTNSGDEVRNASGQCSGDHGAGAFEDYYGGRNGGITLGLLPARSIGYTQVDVSGLALDAWAQPIRYAVAKTVATGTCTGTPINPHWVHAANLKANGIACQPGDLLICKSATGVNAGASPPNCGGAANQVMSQSLVVAIVFSTGKNALSGTGGTGADESTNVKSNATQSPMINPLFVFHPPTPSDYPTGEFDDQYTWITAGELYSRLLSAGILP